MADDRDTRIDVNTPSTARLWDYMLGGKDHYPSDRAVGEHILDVFPGLIAAAQADRGFLNRAITYLAAEVGIRQFLDIGAGLPTAHNTHQVAQRVAPESRIVYVDNDPIVLRHAEALLTSSPQGATDYVEADVRNPSMVLSRAADTVDFAQPVAVMLLGILNFVPDNDIARMVVRELLAACAPGSHLVISHPTREIDAEAIQRGVDLWNEAAAVPIVLRSPAELEGFFDGTALLAPGVVSCNLWRPAPGADTKLVTQFCGVGRIS